MEACSSAHFWARKLGEFGHTVRLIAPQFVRPYVKANKTDAADAQAICEAVGRPGMRFVPLKSVENQTLLTLHRARQGFIKSGFGRGPARGVRNVECVCPRRLISRPDYCCQPPPRAL